MKLGIEQIACALDLPQGKVERWIRQGRIPLVRNDSICTFDRQTLERWARQNNLSFRPDGRPSAERVVSDDTGLTTALRNGGIYYDVEGDEAKTAFEAAVNRMAFLPDSQKPDLVEKLIERESLTSTGIGKGIAIPHPREPESLGLEIPAVAACFMATPIDFEALDARPVSIMFILLSPSVRVHLQLLSRLSFCLRQEAFISFLQQTPDTAALITRLGQLDAPCQTKDRRHG
jgi:PTS system nitrogen regulatory IIA component